MFNEVNTRFRRQIPVSRNGRRFEILLCTFLLAPAAATAEDAERVKRIVDNRAPDLLAMQVMDSLDAFASFVIKVRKTRLASRLTLPELGLLAIAGVTVETGQYDRLPGSLITCSVPMALGFNPSLCNVIKGIGVMAGNRSTCFAF